MNQGKRQIFYDITCTLAQGACCKIDEREKIWERKVYACVQQVLLNSEHSKSLKVPLVTKASCRGFTYYAAKLWNSLPSKMRVREKPHQDSKVDRKRLNAFKSEIKAWICDGGVPFK